MSDACYPPNDEAAKDRLKGLVDYRCRAALAARIDKLLDEQRGGGAVVPGYTHGWEACIRALRPLLRAAIMGDGE